MHPTLSTRAFSMVSPRYMTRLVFLCLQIGRPIDPSRSRRAYSIMSSQDSDAAPGPRLLSLAPEVVETVIKQVEKRRDLSNTQLVGEGLDKHAVNELFKDVFVSPLKKHMSTWNSISLDDKIRHIPRHAIIHTQSNIKETSNGGERRGEEVGDDFEDALAALSRFPSLDSVEIGFTPECVGDRPTSWFEEVVEGPSRRKDTLTLIFQAIKDRAETQDIMTIRKLTIINLQNCPIPDFTSSDLFRQVMSQLEELHISITQEYNQYGPDRDWTRPELQTFPAHLCSEWLQPVSGNLRALSLYHGTDNWGPFPGYFDPSGISFPKLETLALGYYTLAHDSDLDWILAIKSLRKLVLHNCMIASWMRIDSTHMEEWKVRTHDWTRLPNEYDDSGSESFAYGGKWSQSLDRIAGGLPNLTDFRFDQPSPYARKGEPQYGLAHRDSCGVRISPLRYVSFDDGMCPTPFIEAEDDGFLESWLDDGFPTNVHQENLEQDQKSLDRLMDRLGKPRT